MRVVPRTCTIAQRVQPTRIKLNSWGMLAVEVALVLTAELIWSSFSFGLKRADITSKQIESDGVAPPQPVDLPDQQAS